jgi:hypothetical protein
MADGRFGAQVVIESGHGGPEIVNRRFSALTYFVKEADAVEYAMGYARRWIDDQG